MTHLDLCIYKLAVNYSGLTYPQRSLKCIVGCSILGLFICGPMKSNIGLVWNPYEVDIVYEMN